MKPKLNPNDIVQFQFCLETEHFNGRIVAMDTRGNFWESSKTEPYEEHQYDEFTLISIKGYKNEA